MTPSQPPLLNLHHSMGVTVSVAKALMLLIVIMTTTLYGTEVLSIGNWGITGDIGVYQLQFDRMQNFNNLYTQIDPGFYGLMLLYARFLDFPSFLITCYFLFYFSLIAPMYRVSSSAILAIVVFACCYFFPSYNSLTTLVLRQGLGFSVLFMLSFYFYTDRKMVSVFKILAASMFHASFLFYLPVLFVSWMIRQLFTLSIVWLVIAILYAANIPLKLADLLPENIKLFYRVANATETEFVLGFKPLFLLLSLMPMLCLLFRPYYEYAKKDMFLFNMFRVFTIANGIAMLFSGIPYYDRIMLFSWVLVPLFAASFVSFMLEKTRV